MEMVDSESIKRDVSRRLKNCGCSAEWLVASSCMLVQRHPSFFASERAQHLRKEGWSIPSHYLRRQILRHFRNCRKLRFFLRLINSKSKKVRLRNKLGRFRVSILVHNLAGGLRLTLDALARQNAHQLHARMSHNVKKNFAKFPKNLSWTRLHTQRNFINDF